MPLKNFLIPLLLILLFLSAFISAIEIAIISFNKVRLKHLRNKGVKKAQAVYEVITHLDSAITLILILNNLVNVSISAILTTLFIIFFGYKSVTLSIFFISIIIIIFCEIVPKLYGSKIPERLSLAVSPYLLFMLRTFRPFINFFTKGCTHLANFLLRIRGITPLPRMPLVTEEEIKVMIEVGRDEGLLGDKEKEMLHKIFELSRIKVKDVMVDAEDIIMIDEQNSRDEIVEIALTSGYTRFPVYRETRDNIVGVIDTRDVIYLIENPDLFVVNDLVSDIYRVKDRVTAGELLRSFQKKKTQLALVLDEKDKILGMVTLEDLIEEIVGELEEEKLPLSNFQ